MLLEDPDVLLRTVFDEGRNRFADVDKNTSRRSGVPTFSLAACLQYYDVFEELVTITF